MTETKLEDFLSAKELGEALGVSINTVLQWQGKGLQSYRIGRRRWFNQFEVSEFIKSRLKVEG